MHIPFLFGIGCSPFWVSIWASKLLTMVIKKSKYLVIIIIIIYHRDSQAFKKNSNTQMKPPVLSRNLMVL